MSRARAPIECDERAGLACLDFGSPRDEAVDRGASGQKIVPVQVAGVGKRRRCCSSCRRLLASKGYYSVTFRSLFGDFRSRSSACLSAPARDRTW
jgi:hypothetical protein